MANWILKDLPAHLYFANQALGSTSIKTLSDPEISLQEAKYLIEKVEHKKTFDVGTLAHALILEGSMDEHIVEVPFDSYRKKDAQVLRDAAYAAGKIPVNESERASMLGDVEGMRDAVMKHDLASELLSDFEPEVSLFWKQDGVPCKARIDALHRKRRVAVDLKTSVSARPNDVRKRISDLGYYIQAAHYLDGLSTVLGESMFGFEWYFVFVQNTAPYIVSVHQLTPAALDEGRLRAEHGRMRWKQAQETGWPGYDQIFSQELTVWESIKNEDLVDELITV